MTRGRPYISGVRFCPWYRLAEAGAHAPAEEGVLQVRVATGLIDYPTGKSAMVHYAHAPDVRAAAIAWASAHGADGIVCRHLIERDTAATPAALCARLLDDFARRFGAPPGLPGSQPAGAGDPR